jgi:DNA repair protein RecN (Recombination protein N)
MTRLLELRVHGLGILQDVQWAAGPGFGILTGETGAGKSLCIAALRWVLGGRIEGDAVREGTSVAAVFESDDECLRLLGEIGVRADDLVTLTREAGAGGRSTCRVNASLVSQAALRDLGELLAEITVQGSSHRLLRRGWQRRALDASGGDAVSAALLAMREAHRRWRSAEAALAATDAARRREAAELAEAEAVIAELAPLRLREEEEEELGDERLRLRHAAAISGTATRLAGATAGEEGGAAELLERSLAEARKLDGVDRRLSDLLTEAGSLAAALRDLATASRRLAGEVELDPARLEAVEERLDTLARVRRRHGSVEAALRALADAVDARDAAAEACDRAALAASASSARADAVSSARRLSNARRDAAARLEAAVGSHLAALELPHARFRVTLGMAADPEGLDLGAGPVRCDGEGVDQVELRLCTTRDGVPLPLDEGPSGGELSRLALALAAAGTGAGQPLLVLDEVDTGVGGETAARVGDLLAEIGRGRQVLALTHRPEIAARAAWHLAVRRYGGPGGGSSSVVPACGRERVVEIARMMSGRTTAAALTRAAELLEEGAGAAVARLRAG